MGLLGEEDTGQHLPTITQSACVARTGVVTVGEQAKPIKQDSHFYPLKRRKAAFSGLDHAQLNFQFLKVHWVLLECFQTRDVISRTPLLYGVFKKFRNSFETLSFWFLKFVFRSDTSYVKEDIPYWQEHQKAFSGRRVAWRSWLFSFNSPMLLLNASQQVSPL